MTFTLAESASIPVTADMQRFTVPVTGGTLHVIASRLPDGSARALSSAFQAGSALPPAKYSTINVTTGSLAAGAITGAQRVFLLSTNAVPGAQLVRTAAQMLADQGAAVGDAWSFRIITSGAGTLTLTTDAGSTVTLTGTMTVAQNTWRDFFATFNSATTATIQSVGTGTI
jgi:hypothetical protein